MYYWYMDIRQYCMVNENCHCRLLKAILKIFIPDLST